VASLLTLRATEELQAKFADDVRLVGIPLNVDERGRLVEFDFSVVPFPVRRAFAVADVPAGTTRGGHRHRDAAQLLSCVTGSVAVELRRGEAQHELELTPEMGGLYIAPGVWASQRYVREGTVLVVLASAPFDPASYDTEY
jgi:dTDP-4-dehydrorhamnose 3,5-epimerase-like enzyme